MSLDDYREVWQEQEPPEGPGADEEELLARVKEESSEYDRKIFWRDVREIVAAVLVAALFGWWAVTAEAVLARVGAAIVVAGAGLIVWKLRRARRNGEDELAARPVAERLRAEIDKVEAQIELLEGVLWWYLGPPGVGIALMVFADGLEGWFEPVYLVGLVVFFGFVWRLNRRAVEESLRPRRRELARMLEQIEAARNASAPDDGT